MKPVRSYANKFWRYYVDKNTVPYFIEWLDKIWQFQWCYWHFCKNSWCRKTVRQWWATATLKRCSTRSPDAEQDGKTRDHSDSWVSLWEPLKSPNIWLISAEAGFTFNKKMSEIHYCWSVTFIYPTKEWDHCLYLNCW